MKHLVPIVAITPALALCLAACGEGSATATADGAATEPAAAARVAVDDQAASSRSGSDAVANSVPAQSIGDQPRSAATRLFGKTDYLKNGQPGCRISFAYAGNDREDVLWDGEECSALTADFADRATLERLGKWDRLDDYARDRIAKTPGNAPLLVEGQFTASLYPLDFNGLSYEVKVAD